VIHGSEPWPRVDYFRSIFGHCSNPRMAKKSKQPVGEIGWRRPLAAHQMVKPPGAGYRPTIMRAGAATRPGLLAITPQLNQRHERRVRAARRLHLHNETKLNRGELVLRCHSLVRARVVVKRLTSLSPARCP
jgi:hypothetical protein